MMTLKLRRFGASFSSQAASSLLPLEHCIKTAITPDVCEDLAENGFAVVDNVFKANTSHLLREEIKSLRDHMHTNCTHLVSKHPDTYALQRLLVPKKNIFEAELSQPKTQALAPLCSLLQNDHTLRVMLNLFLGLETPLLHQKIKLQWNAGNGACFPIHCDTDASIDGRVVTAIWYLNPTWQPGDGGELRLYPFPQAASPITIDPINDRLVLFSSQKMAHRVLPSIKERYCFTIWLSTAAAAASSKQKEVEEEEERAMVRRELSKEVPLLKLIQLDAVRLHALKWVYRDEWAQSLLESHHHHHDGATDEDEGGQVAAALILMDTFWKEIEVIERALKPLLPVLRSWCDGGELRVRHRVKWF